MAIPLNDLIEFKPIRTPNFVLTTATVNGEPLKYHVAELTVAQVEALCDEFRENMLSKCTNTGDAK